MKTSKAPIIHTYTVHIFHIFHFFWGNRHAHCVIGQQIYINLHKYLKKKYWYVFLQISLVFATININFDSLTTSFDSCETYGNLGAVTV